MRTTSTRNYSRISPARVVLQPMEGASLRETLIEARTDENADRLEATATGRIDRVHWSAEAAASANRAGVLDVISLTAIVQKDEVALALVATDASGAIVAGPLLDARVVELSLSLALFAEDKQLAPTTTKPRKLASSDKATNWADVAAASAAAQEPDDDDGSSDEPPRPGDTIEHATFGVCAVEKLEDDEDFVLVRTPQGRVVRLSLEVLRPELLSETGGHRAFRSRSRGAKR